MKTTELFDLQHTLAAGYLAQFDQPWQAVPGITKAVAELGMSLGDGYTQVAPQVWVHQTAQVAPTAYLGAPCIIGPNAQVRHCAFIRGGALVGEGCVIGNSVELKNAIVMDGAQVPHFNYVGDSILGHKAHLGAGAVTSNVKSDKSSVVVQGVQTGLRKLGALVGDGAEIGCNSVLNPGTVVGRNATVYPLSSVRGVVPEGHIWKAAGVVVKKV